MKKLKCYDCEESFETETSKEMLDAFYAHYMAEHKEIITGGDENEKDAWMKKFNSDWEATKEIEEGK